MASSCTRNPRQASRRLVVADSKRVYRGGQGLASLERTVLVTLSLLKSAPATWMEFMERIAGVALEDLCACPWYGGADSPLPLDPKLGNLATRVNALRLDCATRGVRFLGAAGEVLSENRLNRFTARTQNKSRVVLWAVLRLISRALKRTRHTDIQVFVDRLGGRTHYREALMTALPDFELHILAETDSVSAYRLSDARRVCTISFVTEGDAGYFPIALASMYSKYTRELCMARFNRFFNGHSPDLKPTAGYYTDAQRWLREAQPLLARLRIDAAQLVRQR